MQYGNVRKFNHLLSGSPVHIHEAEDREVSPDALLHQVDIYPHFAGLSTQLSHDQSSQMCGIPQKTSTDLEPTSHTVNKLHIFLS